jgi:hypothetical protein
LFSKRTILGDFFSRFFDGFCVLVRYKASQTEKGVGKDKQTGLSTSELLSMLTFGAEQMFETDGVDLEDADLDALLDRSRQYDESTKKELEGCFVCFC